MKDSLDNEQASKELARALRTDPFRLARHRAAQVRDTANAILASWRETVPPWIHEQAVNVSSMRADAVYAVSIGGVSEDYVQVVVWEAAPASYLLMTKLTEAIEQQLAGVAVRVVCEW